MEFPRLTDEKRLGLDLETSDPLLKSYGAGWAFPRAEGRGHVAGIAIATQDADWYFPIGHMRGENLPRENVLAWLKDTVRGKDVAGANLSYDAGWLRRDCGIELDGKWLDVQVAAPLLDEHRGRKRDRPEGRGIGYSLDALLRDYLGESKNESALYTAAESFGYGTDVKGNIWRLPPEDVDTYARQDAAGALRLWDHLHGLIGEDSVGMPGVAPGELYPLLEMECELSKLFAAMRWRGVRVDLEKVAYLKREWTLALETCQRQFAHTNIWSSPQVGQLLIDLGVEDVPQTPKTKKPSVTSTWLDRVCNHPIGHQIRLARKYDKAMQFLTQLEYFSSLDGRIHSQINGLRSDDYGTVSGRISMSNPNLQQMPGRDPEIGPLFRECFLPEPGEKWISCDYSEQEPRITLHFAATLARSTGGLQGASTAVQMYKDNPAQSWHDLVAEMTGLSRAHAKTINLGVGYGMGIPKLAAQLGKSVADAREISDQYHKQMPFIHELMNLCEQSVRARGQVRTLLKRRGRFIHWEPQWAKGYGPSKVTPLRRELAEITWPNEVLKRAFLYIAVNKLVQGSAADQTKKAMLDIFQQEGIIPLLQVHDELCVSGDAGVAEKIQQRMVDAIPLSVPILVKSKVGDSWGSAA
jgi:DNA polymerase I-like protein with 3'-5' exonuclease and polymerase domains